ncbi:uncharacterized protein DSM5745_11211 [Aspergillus mulundensis]|uniref:F-box domain-containing protein n=1 Tax=Aspergillus mulundensis TaxID=1810919 RepID=A0A3D8QAY1_9EURO|nr:hypothetical protein DSM5745_11211 [Aspergillus mulundensis]RDW59005.1 hypothetical protein DSM5745_11211 [Aspergillus mulundensis]
MTDREQPASRRVSVGKLHLIASHVTNAATLNALTQTCRKFHELVNPILYSRFADKMYAWIAKTRDIDRVLRTLIRAHKQGKFSSVNCLAYHELEAPAERLHLVLPVTPWMPLELRRNSTGGFAVERPARQPITLPDDGNAPGIGAAAAFPAPVQDNQGGRDREHRRPGEYARGSPMSHPWLESPFPEQFSLFRSLPHPGPFTPLSANMDMDLGAGSGLTPDMAITPAYDFPTREVATRSLGGRGFLSAMDHMRAGADQRQRRQLRSEERRGGPMRQVARESRTGPYQRTRVGGGTMRELSHAQRAQWERDGHSVGSRSTMWVQTWTAGDDSEEEKE